MEIAYSDSRSIRLVSSDLSRRQTLTDPAGRELEPQWSPDGWRILFLRRGSSVGKTPDALRSVSSAGGDERLVAASVSRATWSPDRTMIAFIRGGAGRQDDPAGVGTPGNLWIAANEAPPNTRLRATSGRSPGNHCPKRRPRDHLLSRQRARPVAVSGCYSIDRPGTDVNPAGYRQSRSAQKYRPPEQKFAGSGSGDVDLEARLKRCRLVAWLHAGSRVRLHVARAMRHCMCLTQSAARSIPSTGWNSWQPMRAEKKSCPTPLAKLTHGTTSLVTVRSSFA
jgi:WD40-like Beta Propeller Repeat